MTGEGVHIADDLGASLLPGRAANPLGVGDFHDGRLTLERAQHEPVRPDEVKPDPVAVAQGIGQDRGRVSQCGNRCRCVGQVKGELFAQQLVKG